MKKQILKTCVAAALCLGGMSQAMAANVGDGAGNTLTVNSQVSAGTCEFDTMSPVNLTALTSALSSAANKEVVGEKDVQIKVKGCPGNQKWKSDSAIKQVSLTVSGTAQGNDYFQLKEGSTAITDYAVSLKADSAEVKPNTVIDLKNNGALADAADNAITLKAGLVKLGTGVVAAKSSSATLTVAIAYQ
ncbi:MULTISPECIES: fimbrial protein [Photorhabdus]|uniref:Fimbrial protein n=1 Tax=Photorhabdus kayaii TaxID=230088 RepID=A0ABX0B2I4_9GAMM|nr:MULTISPECIES: fimbrial protein [Photorhabdus]MCC8373068.1 type 1 fimbrial protein [Photorhabdus bodei]MCT8351593.1 fimbrial protein [Photorhabdus kayaii]MDB6367325.1 fimbrial protein [Photorhabdus bodei]NDL13198.1 fimbrial protein [Photorhabdus kayaii]NDL26859.1 fimbrial protein [Photorhabdus kayaii]